MIASLAGAGHRAAGDGRGGFELRLREELSCDCVFDTGVVVEGPRQRQVRALPGPFAPPADSVVPELVLGLRTLMDEKGAARLLLPVGEPEVVRHRGCTVLHRTRTELAVSGELSLLWWVLREVDGVRSCADLLEAVGPARAPACAELLGVLLAVGAAEPAGRATARFLHSATKKGVLPARLLNELEVLRLVTDGRYRSYPGASIVVLAGHADATGPFHSITRERRSPYGFEPVPLGLELFSSVLTTACGATGAQTWEGSTVSLRAYPSSGGLYAIEIYPVVFAVAGVAPGIYHYSAAGNHLEEVRADAGREAFLDAAVPAQRPFIDGAAALVCLTANFPRHEAKYGEGGYRMLVLEAGHISQNLLLAATAAGIQGRPCGGFFDELVNRALGLDGDDEQFVVSVLLGVPLRAGDGRS